MQNGFFQNLIRTIEWSLITDFDIILTLNIPYNSQSIKDLALSVNLNKIKQIRFLYNALREYPTFSFFN